MTSSWRERIRLAAVLGIVASGIVVLGAQAAKPAAAALIQAAIDKDGLAAGQRVMNDIDAHPDQYLVSEREVNALGYRYLAAKALGEAIAVFEFNVRRFSGSDNVYDSLSEALGTAGQKDKLEATLRAWLQKPGADSGTPTRVAAFRAMQARREEELRNPYKPGQPTGIRGPYLGQAPPGTTPSLFAPGIVSLLDSGEYASSFSADGKEYYFTRAWNDRARPQVTMVSRLGEGGWTAPEPATFSQGFSAHEPHVSRDDKRIYWGWFRPLPSGVPNPQKLDYGIWACDRTSGGWSDPVFVGQGMFVSTANDGSVYVTDHTEQPNGYLAKAKMVNGRFAGFERLEGGMKAVRAKGFTNIAHPAISPDGSFIVFDVEGGFHLFACFRNADDTWGEAMDLADHGLDRNAQIPYVSPDGKYLFFALRGDVYWVSTDLIKELKNRT